MQSVPPDRYSYQSLSSLKARSVRPPFLLGSFEPPKPKTRCNPGPVCRVVGCHVLECPKSHCLLLACGRLDLLLDAHPNLIIEGILRAIHGVSEIYAEDFQTYHSDGKSIDSVIVHLCTMKFVDLGGAVWQRTAHRKDLSGPYSDPKVGDFDGEVRFETGYQNIRWLYVSVHD